MMCHSYISASGDPWLEKRAMKWVGLTFKVDICVVLTFDLWGSQYNFPNCTKLALTDDIATILDHQLYSSAVFCGEMLQCCENRPRQR